MSVDIYKSNAQDDLSLAELDLYHQIMDYRAEEGLEAIPLSASLTTTAGRHVVDTRENIWGEDLDLPSGTNLHSWSDAPYYSDARDPSVMWEAPERLGTGYTSSGYEISAAGQDTSEEALDGWKASSGHNDVITNQNSWADIEYNAIGIGLDNSSGAGPYGGKVYHVWFGAATDSAGPPDIIGSSKADVVTGTTFGDRIFGRYGDDLIYGKDGDDLLQGDSGDDTLSGADGADRIYGKNGDDRVYGKDGGDDLSGAKGNDWLSGASGNDTLYGGEGVDLLSGGTGRDVFEFRSATDSPRGSRDEITSFSHGTDRIDLSDIDANSDRSGNQSFDFIGRAKFSHEPGELRYTGGTVQGDLDGNGVAELQIDIGNGSTLTSDDFIL